MKILVLSCDKYKSCWSPFFQLLDKYYPHHPEAYLLTEKEECPYCKTINIDNPSWVYRFREALKKINDKEVLILLDDFFIRQPVDEKRISEIEFDDDTIVYNFELMYRPVTEIVGDKWGLQKNNQIYLNSCQPSIWNREKLIERLNNDNITPQEWELTVINSPYKHYINAGEYVINVGHRYHKDGWGITRGKLTQECIGFLESEGIDTTELRRDFGYHKKLSIITPYYKSLPYTKELAEVLQPQLNDDVEWIIIDDGCHETDLNALDAIIVHTPINSGGPSKPRNTGLKIASGDYIAFIDSDDLVTHDYIELILDKIKTSDFDYCYMSWYTKRSVIVIEDEPPAWNTSIWNCIYRRSMIGDEKFNEDMIIGEDYDFNNRVRHGKRVNIPTVIYYYRNDRDDSLTHQLGDGTLWAKI